MTSDRPWSGSVLRLAIRNSSQKSKVPAVAHSITMPATKPRSPSLVIQKAFTAARAADGRSYQKPISRYEQRPTSSQETYICRNVGDSTRPSIENANSEW